MMKTLVYLDDMISVVAAEVLVALRAFRMDEPGALSAFIFALMV
jgi:hypothetical protein